MRSLTPFIVATCLSVTPVAAQETPPSTDEGMSLIERGARMLMEQLLGEVEPHMKDLKEGMDQAMTEMGPALRDLMAKIDDIRNYHPPEVLPNGDIIIRRKTPAELASPPAEGELDL